MDKLIPQNYEPEVVKVPSAKDLKVLEDQIDAKTFIQNTVTEPTYVTDVVKMVNNGYAQTGNENLNLTNEEIVKVAEEINDEWHPVEELNS